MSQIDSKSEETIFSTALHHSPAERGAYLDQVCAGDRALRQRIEDLLKAQPQLGEFMEKPVDGGPPGARETVRIVLPPEEGPGARIGRYKLLQKLGEGGCGVVYMAEQDEPVRRKVALKVIKLGMDTKSVIARFEAERQALAMMDHPNIAKVLEAGATETGRPYFVMELVRGIKITEFCDQNRLSTRERLELFIPVCHAVQHAHQKGIIHRDLKPSNILVTMHDPGSPPVPKVIDFGIAKATQGRLTDQTLFTAFEQFLGTPAYMSPEQALMTVLDVDTRSDIYSLGVLLYELLTGSTPFNPKDLLASGLEEMRRTIREKEPPRPSTRLSTLMAGEQVTAASYRQTEAPKLIHLVRGDLDWIVMKCLEKDRARRYETANALAVDLRRHLNNEPVTARPPSRLYEFQKTVRRHKLGFAAAATVMATLAVAVGLSTWQARRARFEQRRAEQNLYVADMQSAQQALAEGNSDGTRRLLARYLPAAGVPDLRGWEWRFLAEQSRSEESGRLIGHRRWVRDLCFLENGQLLSVGFDRRIIWWDWPQQRAIGMLTNVMPAWRHALAPDRRTVALMGPFGFETNLYLLDTQTRELRALNLSFRGTHLALAYSPSGELAVGSEGEISLWDGSRVRSFVSFANTNVLPELIRFAPEGHTVAIGTEDGRISLYGFPGGELVRSWKAHEPGPQAFGDLLFSPDSQWLVSSGGGGDRRVCVWNPGTAELITPLDGHHHVASAAPVFSFAFSADGKWLATGGADQTVRIWDTKSWTTRKIFSGHSGYVYSVVWSPDGRHLVSANSSGELLLWDWPPPATTGEPLPYSKELSLSFSNSPYSTLLSPAGDFLVRVLGREKVGFTELRDLHQPQRVDRIRNPEFSFKSAAALPAGRVVTGEADGTIRLWEPERGSAPRQLAVAQAGPGPVIGLAGSRDGRVLVSASSGRVRSWNLPALTPGAVLRFGADPLSGNVIALSADGSRLAFGSTDDRVQVYDLPGGQLAASWQADSFGSRCIALSPDGRLLATGSDVGTGGIWSFPGPRLLAAIEGNAVTVTSLAFSPDGSRLAVGLLDGTVRLLDGRSAKPLLTFHKHTRHVLALAFTVDGTELISVSNDTLHICRAPQLRDLEDTVAKLTQLRHTPD